MRRYYMVNIILGYRIADYYKNKREARKDFKNAFGVYPDYIELED